MKFRLLGYLVLALCVATLVHGFIQVPAVTTNHKPFTAVLQWIVGIWLVTGVLVWRLAPRYAVPLAVVVGLVFATGASGPAAVLTVLLIGVASYLVGDWLFRRALPPEDRDLLEHLLVGVAGFGLFITVLVLLSHFPVHYRWTHLALLVAPLVLRRRRLIELVRASDPFGDPRAWTGVRELATLWMLLVVLGVQLFTSSRPETGMDALAYHLVIPHIVSVEHYFPYDFRSHIWAVMPIGGDWAYTLAYLQSGGAGVHLLNFGVLLAGAMLVAATCRRYVSRSLAYLIAALFVSTPIVYCVTSSAFIDNTVMLFQLSAVIGTIRYAETRKGGYLYLTAIAIGVALLSKMTSGVMLAACFGVLLVVDWRAGTLRAGLGRYAKLAGLVLVIGAFPYLNAYVLTGNPAFPFFNGIFHSPYWADESFDFPAFNESLSWRTLYSLTFESELFLEATPGAFGFQGLLLLPLTVLVIAWRPASAGWIALATAVIAFCGVFSQMSYLRYLYPALPIFSIALAVAVGALRERDRWLFRLVVLGVLLASAYNLKMSPAASHGGAQLPVVGLFLGDTPELEWGHPEKPLVEHLNDQYGRDARVAFLTRPVIAGLDAPSLTWSWHSHEYALAMGRAKTAEEVERTQTEFGVTHFILLGEAKTEATAEYLAGSTELELEVGTARLYRVKGVPGPGE